MKIAVTGAAGRVGRILLPRLREKYQVRAFDLTGCVGVEVADVCDPDAMAALCAGCEAVIHLAQASWDEADGDAFSQSQVLATRLKGTYNVLQAAVTAGVRRVVQLSDLCVYAGYGPDLVVSEDFVPAPDTSAYAQSVYLSELVGREFARQYGGLVLTLRLGKLVEPASLSRQAVFCPEWVAADDLAAALEVGLAADSFDGFSHWGLYNVAAAVPGSRYDVGKLCDGRLDWQPQQDFAAWRKGGTS